jgi:ubiquinone/menaquinone biosynthesis C-methylase UbiE
MAGAKVIVTDIDRVLDEVKRTLKASGILAIEAVLGSEQGPSPASTSFPSRPLMTYSTSSLLTNSCRKSVIPSKNPGRGALSTRQR